MSATNGTLRNDVVLVPLNAPTTFQVLKTRGVFPVQRAFASMVLTPTFTGNPNGRRLIVTGGMPTFGRYFEDVALSYSCGLNDIWALSLGELLLVVGDGSACQR